MKRPLGNWIMSFVLLLSLFISASSLSAASSVSVKSYTGKVNIEAREKRLHAALELTLDVREEAGEKLTFLLNKNAILSEVRWNGKAADFAFDKNGVSPNRYLPDARTLTITTPGIQSGSHRLLLKYDCLLNDLTHQGCLFIPNWIELNSYSTWFPINYEYGGFTCQIEMHLDSAYRVSGSGTVSGGDGAWKLRRDAPDTEIVLLASPQLQTRRYEQGDRAIRVDSIGLTDAEAEAMLTACRDTFDRYARWFGGAAGQALTLTINPTRNVTSYARRGFISLQTKDQTEKEIYQTIGHEIGHFWWRNALSSDTWEDWLNESFAEYSALLNAREKYGEAAFQESIAGYRKVAAGLPPLWNLPRGGENGALTLYRKGPIILYELDRRLGHKAFLHLLQAASAQKVARTSEFLSLAEQTTSLETRRWLEESLKK